MKTLTPKGMDLGAIQLRTIHLRHSFRVRNGHPRYIVLFLVGGSITVLPYFYIYIYISFSFFNCSSSFIIV